ncbi:MAG: sigma-70 family RNA polymerase sigma factor [Actinomycetota bacterium]|nr:sigma-70 family RNA polymerase sigma factor [Actinomycetota bacterium]
MRLCRERLGSGHDSEALAQEAFLRAWRSWWQYDDGRPFGPWVGAIARRLCNDQARTSIRREEILARERIEATAADDSCEFVMRSRALEEAFRSVSPRARRLIVLRDVEGWSYEDMARVEGVSVESIRGALKRGRAAFRAAYEQIAGAPAALGALRPSWLRRVQRLIEAPRRVPSLEPIAAGLVLLLAPLAPPAPVASVAPVTQAAEVPAIEAPAPEATPLSSVPASASVIAPLGPAPVRSAVSDALDTAVAVASHAVEPTAEGWFYTFAASPDYEHDSTVFALGRSSPCDAGRCAVLLKSTDGGSSWARLSAEGLKPGRIMLPPDHPRDKRIFVATEDLNGLAYSLLLSVDGGATFTQVATGVGSPSMAMSPSFSAGDPRILIGDSGYQPPFVYNADSGTIEPLVLPLPPGATPKQFVFADDGALLVSTLRTPGHTSVFRCDDDGCVDALDVRTLDLQRWEQIQLSQRDGAVLASARDILYRSTDHGRSFEPVSVPALGEGGRLLPVVSDERGRLYARTRVPASGATVLSVSDDLGASWTPLPHEERWALNELVVLPDGVMLAAPFAVDAPSFVCSTDGGASWSSRCERSG